MTQRVADILGALDERILLSKAAGWDPVGLQLGDGAAPVNRVGVCHEVTEAVVDAVTRERIDLLVTYHPLLFHPTTRLVVGRSPGGRAHRLISAGVALVVVHTAFDVCPGGSADSLAATLGLIDPIGFGPTWGWDAVKVVTFVPPEAVGPVATAMEQAGAGRIGNYTACSYRSPGVGTFYSGTGTAPMVGADGRFNEVGETRLEMIAPAVIAGRVVAALVAAHPYEEPGYDVYEVRSNAGFVGRAGTIAPVSTVDDLAALVSERIGGVLRVAGTGPVKTVAVLPGSGASFIEAADADVLVTGDVGHHRARAALDRGMAIIDPGHAATERPGLRRLYAAVAQSVSSVVDLTDIDVDPWRANG